MRCSKCGRELEEGEQICILCGTPVQVSGGDNDQGAEPPPSLPEGPLPPPVDVQQEFLAAPKRRMSIPVIVAICVVGVLVVAAAIIVPIVLSGKSSEKTASENAERKSCEANQRMIDAAIQTYGATSPDETYPSSLSDLTSPELRVLESIPTCPSGTAEYIWIDAEIGKPPTVSCPNRSDHAE